MNSMDLRTEGLVDWHPFSPPHEPRLKKILPVRIGLYSIRRKRPICRLVGQSDIAYIGSATNQRGLRGRISQYFHPGRTQRTNQRILNVIEASQDFELAFTECEGAERAKALERRLLARHDEEHSELPPLNRKA